MWFTDLGKARARDMDRGTVYWAKADGTKICEVVQPITTPNGIGLSPNEKTLYVAETEGARLYAFPITGDGQVDKLGFPESINGGKLVTCDGGFRRFDSLAVEQNGNICVATLMTGGITVANPNGGTDEFVVTEDPYTTNICFGGIDLNVSTGNFNAHTLVEDLGDISIANENATIIDDAFDEITGHIGTAAGDASSLGFASSYLETKATNLEAARSRIMDADIVEETTNLSKYTIQYEATVAALAQANSTQQTVMELLLFPNKS